MEITYLDKCKARVDLSDDDTRKLISGERLLFDFDPNRGLKRTLFYFGQDRFESSDSNVIRIDRSMLRTLIKKVTEYYPLSDESGFYLALPPRR